MTTVLDLLHSSLWAKGISAEQMRRIEQDVFERSFAAGAVVCRKGEKPDFWFGVIDGLLKMSNVSAEGKSATLASLPNGAWFGEGTLLKDEPRKYDLVALRETRLACMPRASFYWLLDNSIPFNRFLLVQLNERLGQFIGMTEYDRLLEPTAKVARCLAEMFNPHLYPGSGPGLKISQEEIGYLSGVSRQRVNQALQQLEKDGLLTVEYGGIRISNLEKLRAVGS